MTQAEQNMVPVTPTGGAYLAWLTAEHALSTELHRLFGKKAGDVRYTRAGRGNPGTDLRRLHDASEIAAEVYRVDRVLWGE